MVGPKMHMHDELPSDTAYFQRFPSRRSVVYSNRGLVTTSQPLAAEAGLEILRRGGNALDAAVATSAGLAVTEPCMCGIGGDAFCLFYDAKTKTVKGLNGSGRAPKGLSLEALRAKGINGRNIPMMNANAVTVPGCIAAWEDSVKLFGSGKVKLGEILEPAIKLASNGYPVSELTSYQWTRSYRGLAGNSPNGHELLIEDDRGTHAPRPGEVFKNPTLAQTLSEVAQGGKKAFYEGKSAEAIVKVIQDKGGVMTLEDLKEHVSTPVEPITYNYGGPDGVTVHECPPNGHGIVVLIALGIIDELHEMGKIDLSKTEHNSVEWLHILIEVLRLAFADARAHVADPDKEDVPVKQLLSKEYLASRAKLFDPKKATADVRAGTPFGSSDTVLLATADAEGNACTFIQSNFAGFGTMIVPEGVGASLQNRGNGFDLVKGHPNCVAGGKRPYHTIIPAMVTRGDKLQGDLFMAYGVMGGFQQPQGHVQVLLNMLHHNMSPQQALDSPRICLTADVPEVTENGPDANNISSAVALEEGITAETVRTLKNMGHGVDHLMEHERAMFGRGQVIQRLVNGVWAAGSDPRADGHAVPHI